MIYLNKTVRTRNNLPNIQCNLLFILVVWNPWEEKAKAMSDFDDEEFRTMVCVEAGSVSEQVSAPAGGSVAFKQTLRVDV